MRLFRPKGSPGRVRIPKRGTPSSVKPGTVEHALAIGPRGIRRRKTGQPAHFRSWLAEAEAQKVLKSLRTNKLADSVADGRLANTLRALAQDYPTVLILAGADRGELLSVKGVGRSGLRRVQAYLTEHRVPLQWEV